MHSYDILDLWAKERNTVCCGTFLYLSSAITPESRCHSWSKSNVVFLPLRWQYLSEMVTIWTVYVVFVIELFLRFETPLIITESKKQVKTHDQSSLLWPCVFTCLGSNWISFGRETQVPTMWVLRSTVEASTYASFPLAVSSIDLTGKHARQAL
jgi:hypothetical protein